VHASVGRAAILVVGLGARVVAMNLALTSTASAGPNFSCASHAVGQFAAISNLRAKKASWYFDENGEDPRKTYEEWALTEDWAKKKKKPVDAVYERYAPTGRLVCPPAVRSTANLVMKNNLIVTAAHSFYDDDGKARFEKSPNRCKFYVMKRSGDQDRNEIYDVDLSSLKVGAKDWSKHGEDVDWAVVKLKNPVAGVEPYQVDPNAGNPRADYKGLTVSAGQKDRPPRPGDRAFRRPNLAGDGYLPPDGPNLVHRCGRSSTYGQSLWVTNCSAGDRGSGSALLVDPGKEDPGGPLFISAIALTTPKEDRGYVYAPDKGDSSGYLAITGQFRQAIVNAAK